MTCFLIDDDLDDQEFFTIALETIDPAIKCMLADDGVEAIRKLKADDHLTPDLIFLDMRMPRMTGADTIKEIKKMERLKKIPTILYSTSDTEIGSEEAKKAGADYFFTKPTSIPDLRPWFFGIPLFTLFAGSISCRFHKLVFKRSGSFFQFTYQSKTRIFAWFGWKI